MKVKINTEIPGPNSKSIRKDEERFLAPGLQRFALMAGIVVDKAQGSLVTDVDGNTFIDIIGGIGVNGLGHSHPKWVRAIQAQVERISVGSFTSEARTKLLKNISDHSPSSDLDQIQLYSGGAEAVESALRLAKSFTGKYEFVSFWGAFHGKTMGALSLMGSTFKDKLGPMVPGCQQVPYAYCYRCPLGLSYPSCGIACAEFVRKQIKQNSSAEVAAIIIEPMQGTAGNVIPPQDFLKAIRSIADETGAILIADEMITGFGRTGKYWGLDHSGVRADIVTLGKQFGGGIPVSAVLTNSKISHALPWGNPSGSSSSYGGNPLVCAAAQSALEIIDEEGLVENSRKMGQYFLNKLKVFEEKYFFVGEVRGVGLFLGIELVKDKKTKEKLGTGITHKIFTECVKRGLLTMAYDANFRIQPAMNIDEKTIDEAVEILDEVFGQVEDLSGIC